VCFCGDSDEPSVCISETVIMLIMKFSLQTLKTLFMKTHEVLKILYNGDK